MQHYLSIFNPEEGNLFEGGAHHLLKCSKYSTQRQTLQLQLAILDRHPMTLQKRFGPWSSRQHQRRVITSFCVFFIFFETEMEDIY